jgi:uncharacterized protein YkwD
VSGGSRRALAAAVLVAAAAGARAVVDPREALIDGVNAERIRRGAPVLARSAGLDDYAQARAEEIAASGRLRSRDSNDERGERLERYGYEPFHVSEVMAEVDAGSDAAAAIRGWRRDGPDTFEELMRSEFRDIGSGAATIERAADGDRRVYVVVVGRSWPDLFAERTAPLRDLARVRSAMVQRVNEERRTERRPPLRLDARLSRAAQDYAERMLREGFYGHQSPEGGNVLHRARDASYPVSAVAENLALGPWTVEEAIEGWMNSPGHRRNLLDLDYRDLGIGLAFGRGLGDQGWQLIWVQVFGQPRTVQPGGAGGGSRR